MHGDFAVYMAAWHETKDGISNWSPLRELGRLDLLRGDIVIQNSLRNPMFEPKILPGDLCIAADSWDIMSDTHPGLSKILVRFGGAQQRTLRNLFLVVILNFYEFLFERMVTLVTLLLFLLEPDEARFQDSRSASIVLFAKPPSSHGKSISRSGRSPNQPATEQVMIWFQGKNRTANCCLHAFGLSVFRLCLVSLVADASAGSSAKSFAPCYCCLWDCRRKVNGQLEKNKPVPSTNLFNNICVTVWDYANIWGIQIPTLLQWWVWDM